MGRFPSIRKKVTKIFFKKLKQLVAEVTTGEMRA
jgi:hypothetical protein